MWSWIITNASALTAMASFFGLISLVLIFKQVKESRMWNKLHFTYTFFPNPLEFEAIEIFLDERISFYKRNTPLNDIEVKALIGKEPISEDDKKKLSESLGPACDKNKVEQELYEAGRKLKLFLNQIESYCAAISAGIIDSESAKNVYEYKFRNTYEKALPWIEKLRVIKNEPRLFIETEKILKKWIPIKGQNNKYPIKLLTF
jgi:hypothetical protein